MACSRVNFTFNFIYIYTYTHTYMHFILGLKVTYLNNREQSVWLKHEVYIDRTNTTLLWLMEICMSIVFSYTTKINVPLHSSGENYRDKTKKNLKNR